MKNYILTFFCFSLFVIACKKDETADDNNITQVNSPDSIIALNSSTLVTALNGFSFEAAFINTEPVAYPDLWLQYIDDYMDSTRIIMNNQNTFKSITYYLCSNHANGIVTRSFDHVTFPNNQVNTIKISFNHPQFLVQWYVPPTGELTTVGNVFGFNTSVSKTFTGMLPQYQYEFLDRFLIRYISGISLFPFQHQNWNDEAQFVATQEFSEPIAWDHWYDESWSTWPYNVQSNMYTGFVNSSNDTTYVGLAKGTTNLDTLYFRQATYTQFMASSASVYLDKSGDTLYLGLINNIPGTSNREISLYKYEIANAQLVPLYEKQPLAGSFQIVKFNKGRFFGNVTATGIQFLDKAGIISTVTLPSSAFGSGIKFGRNKLYYMMSNAAIPRVEVYSLPI
ncbi:MAG: hypothetical protein IPO63_09560 [Bacteroidetes bacterium]|nr:hypothetical protein [Bacteroidota bacterium]